MKKTSLSIALGVVFALQSLSATAADKAAVVVPDGVTVVNTVEKHLSRAVTVDRQTARQTEALLAEEEEIQADNRNLSLQIPVLELEERRLKRQISSLTKKIILMEEQQRRYAEIALMVENDIYDASEDLLKSAENKQTPFLKAERKDRALFIEKSVNDPSVSVGEKLRRLLEALNAESDYGASCDVMTEEAFFDGQKTTLQVLRIGRIGYFAMTLDQQKAGVWKDQKTGFASDPALLEPIVQLGATLKSRIQHEMALMPVVTTATVTDEAKEN